MDAIFYCNIGNVLTCYEKSFEKVEAYLKKSFEKVEGFLKTPLKKLMDSLNHAYKTHLIRLLYNISVPRYVSGHLNRSRSIKDSYSMTKRCPIICVSW